VITHWLDALILLWLGACLIHDMKSWTVPMLLTVIPLIGILIWRGATGNWLLALFVVVLIVVSDLPKNWRAGLAAFGGLIFLSFVGRSLIPVVLAILLIWAIWEIGAMGGADAKILIALSLIYLDIRLLIPISIMGGVHGLIAFWKREKKIPYTLAITTGTAIYLLTH
jgi:Flp pilus assembly protein protease CpaA